MRIWKLLALLSCLLLVAALAEETERLPDPFLDGLFIGDDQLQVLSALDENGWETGEEWYNLETEPTFRIRGEVDNRKLLYEYDVYGRFKYLTYLEQWSSIEGCNDAYAAWLEWLKVFYKEPHEEGEIFHQWTIGDYEIKIYDRSFIAGESTAPSIMINFYPVGLP